MGTAIVREACASGALQFVAAVASAGSKAVGADIGALAGGSALGLKIVGDLPSSRLDASVAIDFSRPELSARALHMCRTARVPIVIGTTGHDREFEARVAEAARDVAVLVAPNTSVGVALAEELVRIAAKTLPADFDIEVSEAHHRHKVDAPSGTALTLAASAARGREVDPATHVVSGRNGPGARRPGEIGIASTRAGDIVGSHSVLFAGAGERLTIVHEATDRVIFARGAIQAAIWLARQPPGRYRMADVLGLKTSA